MRLFPEHGPEGKESLRIDPPVPPVHANHLPHVRPQQQSAHEPTYSAVAAEQRVSFSQDVAAPEPSRAAWDSQPEEAILLPRLGRERRPLSAFASPPQPVQATFSPAFEVDGFQWPAVTDQLLLTTQELLAPVVQLLQQRARRTRLDRNRGSRAGRGLYHRRDVPGPNASQARPILGSGGCEL